SIHYPRAHQAAHSFPTRRSSDLCPAKNGLQKTIKPAGNPWRINLKLYDENSIRPQEPFSCLKRLERVHIVVDPDIGEVRAQVDTDRKSTRLNSSHGSISYAVLCL